MKTKKLVNILTASVASLKNEGKFARLLMWKYARPEIFHEIYWQAQRFISKFVRIALVGVFLSFFQEATVIEWIKKNWVMALTAFVGYTLIGRLISVILEAYREKSRMNIRLELTCLIWRKNQSVGIGMRVGSQFRQKLRTARRCNYYDIKNVGLWPIEALSAVFSSIVLLATLAFLNWRICLIFVVTASVTAFVAAYMARWVREREKELQEAEDRADEYYPASLSVDSTFLGTSRALFERAKSLRNKLMSDKVRFHTKALLITTLVGSLTIIALAVQLYMARENLFQSASLVKIGITISTVGMAIGAFSSAMKALFGEQNSIENVRELLEFLELPDDEKNKDDSSFTVTIHDMVRIVEAKFAYPYIANSPNVIRNITLDFIPGEAVVIVGANGSGKTTMGSLLSNIHRPQNGCVMYGGSSIDRYTARSVLEHALVIPQSGDLYDLPLAESLFGVMDMSAIDMNRYSKAITMSGAKEVLDRLPNGIHTQIGTAYTGGVNLSGGEEQRLRLAGFFYRALDPKIVFVIADEPSRHLDPETRRNVYTELIALARDRGKIVLTISHDADLERFDRVIILEKGKVASDHRGENVAEAVRVISRRLAGDPFQNV